MPDMSDSYEMSREDIVFVLTALSALYEDLEAFLTDKAPDKTARESAQWNIDLVNSAMIKLNNGEKSFSDNECRVMYVAALEMRDLMNKILDDKASREYDREMARSTLHSANAMMRLMRKTFIANGIDVDEYLN